MKTETPSMTKDTHRKEQTGVLILVVAGFLLVLVLVASVASFAAWKLYHSVFVVAENPPPSADLPHPEHSIVSEPQNHHDAATETNVTVIPMAAEQAAESTANPQQEMDVESDRKNELDDDGSSSAVAPVRLIADLPPLGPEVPKTLGSTKSPIKYAWESIESLVYDFDIEAELGSRKIKYRGRNTIQTTDKSSTEFSADAQTNQGTGSGFLIHPQGIVVTCAHVVKGATRIEAVMEDTKFNANVIKFDFENDLAVLRLEQTGLPFLTFADSDQVRLGQEVRAIGYPLSDVLGESIKVTRGEVSGRGGPDGVDGFQIDATVNPGNSGGPLVDDTGRIVGVTNSLLAGAGISEVGFAIPSSKVIQLAKQLGIPIVVEDQSAAMSAADVIDRVSPAAVLLKVTVGSGGVGIEPPRAMEYSGYVYESRPPNAGNFSTGLPRDEQFSGKFRVNASGELFSDDSQGMMPAMLGGSSQIGIEVLPDAAPGRTVSRHRILIPPQQSHASGSTLDRYGFESFSSQRRLPWNRQPSPPEKTSKWMLGTESTTVTLGKPSADGIELEKSYSLKVEGESKDQPPLSITGHGKGTFDPTAGRMLNMHYRVTITVNQDNITARIPITLNYRLVDPSALEKERLARKEREQNRIREKARTLEHAGFASSPPTSTAAANEIEVKSVKAVPESPNLNKFDPNK
ncbi:S1C family serine protease [Novipirellula caenicola]